MEKVKLIPVINDYKTSVIEYKKEFVLNNDSMDGTSGLRNCKSFEEWLNSVINNSNEETVREGLVPASTLLAVSLNDNRLIGMVNIRHKLNEHLVNFGGHIGYSVRKIERRHGFATQMLALALGECRSLNISKVLLTCDKKNIASAKTIINNQGILENEIEDETRIVQRYWIDL